MIRDTQLHPVSSRLLHVDFLRVAMDERLKVKVPVDIRGEAMGVKQQGGILEIVQREVEIECLPADIPDHFFVDVSGLAINQSFRVGDLKVDARKVKVLTDAERVIAHVVPPKAEEEKPAAEAAAVAAPEAAEPEVIRKGKAEAEGEAAEAAGEAGGEAKAEPGKKK
jgi:large subunit ribosomal protein L25